MEPNVVYQESKRDVAGFDIDRIPFGEFQPGKEDTDARYIFDSVVNRWINVPDTIFNIYPPADAGQAPSGQVRMFCTLGGYVFGELPATAGDFVLQAGRIEE